MRLPRIDFPGARHHVMNRVPVGTVLFANDATRLGFLDLFADAELTRKVNATRGADGALFRGRFKNRVIESDDDWRYVLRYVHANPVRAGLSDAETAAWTSHRAYMGRELAPAWLDFDAMLAQCGGRDAYAEAWRAHCEGTLEAPSAFAGANLWGWQLSGPFTPLVVEDDGVALDVGLAQVAAVTGTPVEEIVGPAGAGRRVPARWCAAWWLSRRCGIGQGRICAVLGVGHDALSRDIRRFEQRRGVDARFAGWVAGLEKVSSVKI